MMFMQTSELPPLDPTPVNVQLTIHPSNGQYIAYLMVNMDRVFPITIPKRPHDVKNLNILLREAVQQVAGNFGRGAAYEAALGELARIGNYAFQEIFPDPQSQQRIRSALHVGTFVQIIAEDFSIPWDLLYDGPLDGKASISYYWGMGHVISRTIIQDTTNDVYVPPIIETKRPKIGLVSSDRLPFVEKQEIPMLKELHKRKRIELSHLRALSTDQRSTELAEFGRFLSQELQFLHFACHSYEQDPIERSFLYITKDFSVSMIDFVVGKYQLQHNPFVILNACLTSVINPLYSSSWAGKLRAHGARGVLATDFLVPDQFGAAFSEVIYQHLLAGMPIGETLLATRRQFWNEQRNPLGLAYGLYSLPSIRIARSKKR